VQPSRLLNDPLLLQGAVSAITETVRAAVCLYPTGHLGWTRQWEEVRRVALSSNMTFEPITISQTCYPVEQLHARDAATLWSRILLLGHLSFAVACFSRGYLYPPLLLSLGPFACGFLFFLCNSTQHVGLHQGAADFRLNTRTFIPCAFIRFLYWHMNWHTEHHMYSAVPCYNLSELHALISHDLPPPPVGLIETWKVIARALKAEANDPAWRATIAFPKVKHT
jgi:fatty acid desaturase